LPDRKYYGSRVPNDSCLPRPNTLPKTAFNEQPGLTLRLSRHRERAVAALGFGLPLLGSPIVSAGTVTLKLGEPGPLPAKLHEFNRDLLAAAAIIVASTLCRWTQGNANQFAFVSSSAKRAFCIRATNRV
jgi:hypothetical protein